jgi:hypothetical protein
MPAPRAAFALALTLMAAPQLSERVVVEQIQIPFRLWPVAGDPAACRLITRSDFELWIERKPVTDFEVSFEPFLPASGSSTQPPPRHVVVWLDEAHLFGPPEGNETLSRSEAFTQTAALLARLPESTTLTLVDAFDTIELYETGSPSEVLPAFERLREHYRTWHFHTRHFTDRFWWEGLEDGARRLAATPGHKDLFFVTSDVPVDVRTSEEQRSLAALFAQKDVSIYPVRMAWQLKGLAYGLLPLAEAGGGHMFANKTDVATAVDLAEKMAPCRGVFITRIPAAGRKTLSVAAVLHKKGFDLTVPMAIESVAPSSASPD